MYHHLLQLWPAAAEADQYGCCQVEVGWGGYLILKVAAGIEGLRVAADQLPGDAATEAQLDGYALASLRQPVAALSS
jgi:hypothetical protein